MLNVPITDRKGKEYSGETEGNCAEKEQGAGDLGQAHPEVSTR